MTKKDYIKIANILKECIGVGLIQDVNHREGIIKEFCRMLKSDNSNFNNDRFTNYINGVK